MHNGGRAPVHEYAILCENIHIMSQAVFFLGCIPTNIDIWVDKCSAEQTEKQK